MGIYIVFFIILFIGSFIIAPNKKSNYNIFIFVCLWLLIGLRPASVGSDTLGYIEGFKDFSNMSFDRLIKEISHTGEWLYYLPSWGISRISSSSTFFLLFWALFPAISLYITFKNELSCGQDYIVAFICFFILGLFAFYVAGIRQTAALSLTLLSYKYIKDRKLIYFLIIVFVASFIHRSALLFIIAYPLSFIKAKWWYVFFIIVFVYLSSFLSSTYIFLVSRLFFTDTYSNYERLSGSQNASAFIVQAILFAICCIQANALIKKDKSNSILLIFSMIGLMFQSMSGLLAEVSRVSFYYCIFNLILVPRAINEYNIRFSNKVVYYLFVIICLYYLFFLTSSNLPEYKFV